MPNPLNSLVDTAGDAVRKIIAYHGSPHHFDKFDASRIGTGEGAQAYGQGLYFAGAEPTAKWYRDKLSDTVYDHIFDGKVIGTSNAAPGYSGWTSVGNSIGNQAPHVKYMPIDSEQALLQRLMKDSYHFSEPITESAKNFVASVPEAQLGYSIGKNDHARAAAMAQEWLDSKRLSSASRNSGAMYEVEIGHSPESLLNWESPLSSKPGVDAIEALHKKIGTGLSQRELAEIKDGSWRYNIDTVPQKAAATWIRESARTRRGVEVLKDAGVPGLKYLDGNSRSQVAGDNTRNYVMFPGTEDSISILRKYGLLPAVGVGAAAMSQNPAQTSE